MYAPKEYRRIIIFTEGAKTEVNYFEGFKRAIANPQNPRSVIYKDFIIIEGRGLNTTSLVEYARKREVELGYENASVWLVYDKDSFPPDRFDVCSQMAGSCSHDGVQFNVAWSNECIELWFLLHFQALFSAIDRTAYYDRLDEKFKQLGYADGYEKNIPSIFQILLENGDPLQAMRRAEKLQGECGEAGLTPSQACPCTLVHLLVRELAQYLPPEMATRFIPAAP